MKYDYIKVGEWTGGTDVDLEGLNSLQNGGCFK